MRSLSEFEERLHDGFAVEYLHRLIFTRDIANPDNPILKSVMGISANGDDHAPGLLIAVDRNVARCWPDLIERISTRCGDPDMPDVRGVLEIPGGEEAKNDPAVIDLIHAAIDRHHIDRRSWVMVIGGGAVIDAVGFAASTAHRGVRLVRLPTTVLAQDDAAIGVKNGVNRQNKKNFVGTFDVPRAVICDEDLLTSLDDRDWCSGFSEAVKIACLKDPELMAGLDLHAERIRDRDMDAARPIIQRCAELHLKHITRGGDPFERLEARPLDFGHWAAHRLEAMSNWDLRHGEAVSIGIALDSVYSRLSGLLDASVCERILSTLERLGLPTRCEQLTENHQLLEGLQEFREHLGGKLTITLLRDIGEPVDVNTMDNDILGRTIAELMNRS